MLWHRLKPCSHRRAQRAEHLGEDCQARIWCIQLTYTTQCYTCIINNTADDKTAMSRAAFQLPLSVCLPSSRLDEAPEAASPPWKKASLMIMTYNCLFEAIYQYPCAGLRSMCKKGYRRVNGNVCFRPNSILPQGDWTPHMLKCQI